MMQADVALPALLAAVRALMPYTTATSPDLAYQRGLGLHTHGDVLTLTAGNGQETAQVDLPTHTSTSNSDGDGCVLAADTVIAALTAIKPAGKRAARTAAVTLACEPGRLYLAVPGGSAIALDTDTPTPPATPRPTDAAWSVTRGAVADWCDLVGKVGWAASHDPARPDLNVVRLLRDNPHTTLIVEAIDRFRIHRGCWAQPDGQPVDVRIPIAATERAIKLFTTCDPDGKIAVDVDDEHMWWRTDQVRLQARTSTEPTYPNLELLREDACGRADISFTARRADLLAALDTAATLAPTTRHRQVRLEFDGDGPALDVTVHTDSGDLLHHQRIPITQPAGPTHALAFNPRFARQAIAFLDGESVHVAATTGRLAVYLESGTRHAIIMQLRLDLYC